MKIFKKLFYVTNVFQYFTPFVFHYSKFYRRIIAAFLLLTVFIYFYSCKKHSIEHTLPKEIFEIKGPQTYFLPSKEKLDSFVIKGGRPILFHNSVAEIKVAVVLCGDKLNQTMVTLKSVIILSHSPLHFIVISDEQNKNNIRSKMLQFRQTVLNRLSFEIHSLSFPNDSSGLEWKKLFKLCAAQRLFLPTLLNHIDSLIYVDIDVLFMHPIEDLWKFFYQMNSSQIAGVAPEHEDFATGWYNRFARHPFYGPLGVNSGVMLMNLTRMREFKWQSYLEPVMREYHSKITWGDQDIINIIFHFHPEGLFIFSCEWNYRPDHCMYSSICKTAEEKGVKVIHGSRDVFHNNKQPSFKVIYRAMANFQIGHDMQEYLLQPIKEAIVKTKDNCGKVYTILIKSLEQFISEKQNFIT